VILINVPGWDTEAEPVGSLTHDGSRTWITLKLIDSSPHSCPSNLRLGSYEGVIVSIQGPNIVLRFDANISDADIQKLAVEKDGKQTVTLIKVNCAGLQ